MSDEVKDAPAADDSARLRAEIEKLKRRNAELADQNSDLSGRLDKHTSEVERLSKLNEKLATDAVDLQEVLKETRSEAKERRLEGKRLAEQLASLTAERDEFKGRAEAEPNALQTRIDELQGKIRERDHKDAFTKVAKELRVSSPTKQADLWALSGYKPEGDTPDEAKLKEVLGAALKDRDWFLDPESPTPSPTPTPTPTPTPEPTPTPGPGGDRGHSTSTATATAQTRIPGRL